jgi:hypothetical protein
MKTIFDKTTRDELINRINMLNENSNARWGKMNIYQMLKHSTLWQEWALGRGKCKQVFIGRIFGKMALKNLLKNEKPLRRNSPTSPEFRTTDVKEDGDVSSERTKWIALIGESAHFSKTHLVHSFFGRMTKEQIGYLAYKHADHHLRQFNG